MQQSDVELGAVYQVKVTNKLAPVRIDRIHDGGGWMGTNLNTHRTVRIQSVRKLRGRVADVAKTTDAVEKASTRLTKKRLTKKERDALHAPSKADQEHAPLRDKGSTSPDGMTATSGGERAVHATDEPTGELKRTPKRKKVGCLEAAVQVLEKAGELLTCTQMMERILEQKLWTTAGRTPAATLYSAILRQIQRKGKNARFVLADRGRFTLNR